MKNKTRTRQLTDKRLYKGFISIILLCLLFVLSACQAYQPVAEATSTPAATAAPPKQTVTPAPMPKAGGSLKLAMRLPLTFNPLQNEDANVSEIFKLLYEPLAFYDESLKPVPNSVLIDHINFSADYMSAIVALKTGILWSDGSEITADDLMASLETLKLAPETAVYKTCANDIAAFSLISASSVKFEFVSPVAGQLYFLMFPLVPAGFAEPNRYNTIHEGAFPKVNGIYNYKSYVPSEKLLLSASETALREKPYISDLEIMVTKSHESDILSFEHGLIDTTGGDLTDWSTLVNRSDMRADGYASSYLDYIGFNFERTLFMQKEIRQAVAYSVSKTEIVSGIYMGRAQAADYPISPLSYLIDGEISAFAGELSSLLQASGYTDTDKDNVYEKAVLDKEGFNELIRLELTILYNSENTIRERIAHRMKETLEGNGFSVELEGVPFEEFAARLENKDFDIFIAGVRTDDYRPDLSFLFGESPTNYSGYRSEELELMLEELKISKDELELRAKHSAVQKYLADELPIVCLAFRYDAIFNNSDVFGCENISNAGIYYNMNEWFIN